MHTYNVKTMGAPLKTAQKAMILIHGRGAPAEDILGLADFFDDGSTCFMAPEADNYVWYPYSFMAPREQNQPWLDSAIDNIAKAIHQAEKAVEAENVFIMGFSQGACLTAEITAQNARKYGGIAVFTGGLIGKSIDTSLYSGSFEGTKVYVSNGDNDPHIPLQRTQETTKVLKNMGADVVEEIFPGRMHTINMEEIQKVKFMLNINKERNL